jgi:cell division septation protein DedD
LNREERPAERVRELRLEGLGLALLGGALLAAVLGAFLLGRWVERRSAPPAQSAGGGPLERVAAAEPPVDVEREATHFDRPRGGEQQAEPQREVAPPPPPSAAPSTAPSTAGSAAGSYFVQVFAGRDRASADKLVARLETDGFPVRLLSEPENGGALYKVRVGGYPDQQRAQSASVDLRERGFSGAWVVRQD